MKFIVTVIVFLMVVALPVHAKRTVVFIGLSGKGAPSIEKSLVQAFTEQFFAMPDLQMIEDFELKRLRDRMGTFDFPTVPKEMIETVRQFAPDTALLIWGNIKNYSVKAVRKELFRAFAKGVLTIDLMVYSLAERRILYMGEVNATSEKNKGFIFWGDVQKNTQITAQDMTELLDALKIKSIDATGRIVLSVVQSEMLAGTNSGKVKQNQTPEKLNLDESNINEPNMDEADTTSETSSEEDTAAADDQKDSTTVTPKAAKSLPKDSIVKK
jgi:hypothetical protein